MRNDLLTLVSFFPLLTTRTRLSLKERTDNNYRNMEDSMCAPSPSPTDTCDPGEPESPGRSDEQTQA